MKKVIRPVEAATNKKSSLDKAAELLRKQKYTNENMHKVIPNYQENRVQILDKSGKVVEEYMLATRESEVTRRNFRKATPEEIAKGENLYVAVPYTAHPQEQIPEIIRVNSIGNIYNTK